MVFPLRSLVKYSGVMCHDVCNLLSNGSGEKQRRECREERKEEGLKKEEEKANKGRSRKTKQISKKLIK